MRSFGCIRHRLIGTAVAVLLLLLITEPCAARELFFKVHDNLNTEIQDSPRIGLIQPEVNIYQISAGGVSEKMENWCTAGCENVLRAVQDQIDDGLKIIHLDEVDPDLKEELKDIQGLYEVIGGTVVFTWLGERAFPKEYRKFDYSLGDMDKIFNTLDVDALLFIHGMDQIRTGGRQVMEAFALLAAGAVYSKTAFIEVGLVSRSGQLLWYKIITSVRNGDFREPEGAKAYIDAAFEDFPFK